MIRNKEADFSGKIMLDQNSSATNDSIRNDHALGRRGLLRQPSHQKLPVDRAFPLRDDDGGERIAENIDRDKGGRQQPVHAKDQPDRGDRDVPVAASVDTRTTIAEPATPAPPLEVTRRIPRRPSCCVSDRSMPVACARKIDTAAK